MKRLVVLGILVATLTLLFASTALADPLPPGLPCTPTTNGGGAATCTVNGHNVVLPFFPGPCVPAALDNTGVEGNAIFHVIQNGAGDFWITTTNEGALVGLPAGFSGRATQWFGDENNSMNQVIHAISDGQFTDASGTTLHFHETFHFSISASGVQSPIFFDKCTVS